MAGTLQCGTNDLRVKDFTNGVRMGCVEDCPVVWGRPQPIVTMFDHGTCGILLMRR